MDSKLKYKYEKDFLHAIVTGQKNLNFSIQYWIDVIEESRLRKYKLILVEEHLHGNMSKSDVFRLNQEIAKMEFSHIRKIAFFDSQVEHEANNSFGISLLLKKGLNVMLFNSIKDAKNWLK